MTILFIDDRMHEIERLWQQSGCASSHRLLSLEPFQGIERCQELVREEKPDVVVIGYGLGANKPNGSEVIQRLKATGYTGHVVSNTGGGLEQFSRSGVTPDANASRDPDKLKEALSSLKLRR